MCSLETLLDLTVYELVRRKKEGDGEKRERSDNHKQFLLNKLKSILFV